MGHVRKKKIHNLTWAEGDENAGLEVSTRSVSGGALLDIMELAVKARETKDEKQAVQVVRALFTEFADKALVSWNLEEPVDDDDPDGEVRPVPATLAGLLSQDLDFSQMIIETWIEAVSGTPGDLGKDSTSGVTFPEGQQVTEAQLASLSSSLAPG
jgi:hypothetical protein